jgi:hypothetical protein
MENLGPDLWFEIYRHLELSDVFRLKRLNKSIFAALSSDSFWQKVCAFHFPVCKSIGNITNWKSAFFSNYFNFSGEYGFVEDSDHRFSSHMLTIVQNEKNPMQGNFFCQIKSTIPVATGQSGCEFKVIGTFSVMSLQTIPSRILPKEIAFVAETFEFLDTSFGIPSLGSIKEYYRLENSRCSVEPDWLGSPCFVIQFQFFHYRVPSSQSKPVRPRSWGARFVKSLMIDLPIVKDSQNHVSNWEDFREIPDFPDSLKWLFAFENQRHFSAFLLWSELITDKLSEWLWKHRNLRFLNDEQKEKEVEVWKKHPILPENMWDFTTNIKQWRAKAREKILQVQKLSKSNVKDGKNMEKLHIIGIFKTSFLSVKLSPQAAICITIPIDKK